MKGVYKPWKPPRQYVNAGARPWAAAAPAAWFLTEHQRALGMCSVPSMHCRRPPSLACRAAASRGVGEACGLTAPAPAGGDTAPRLLGPPPEPERQVSSPQDSLSAGVSNPCPVFQLHEQASHICEPLPRGDLQRLRPPQWDSAALRRRPLCERLGECAVLGGGGAGGGSAFLCLAPPGSARRGGGRAPPRLSCPCSASRSPESGSTVAGSLSFSVSAVNERLWHS